MMTQYPMGVRFAEKPVDRLVPGDLLPVVVGDAATYRANQCPNCGYPTGEPGYVYARRIAKQGPLFWIPDGGKTIRVTGELISFPCPMCNAASQVMYLEKVSGLGKIELEGKHALDLRLSDYPPKDGQEQAWAVARNIMGQSPTPKSWALFYGPNGSGKTHLLICLVNAFRVAGIPACYTTSERILRRLRSASGDNAKEDIDQIRSSYEGVQILAIDEADRVKWTDFAGEQLFAIIEGRHAAGLPTFFATNLLPSEMRETSEPLKAIVSRISAGFMVGLGGKDLRPDQAMSLWWDQDGGKG